MTFPVLDHGSVRLIESWGSDERIIESARMSTNKGFQGWGGQSQCKYCGDSDTTTNPYGECAAISTGHSWIDGPPGDEKLLKFLWENGHHTPFEMAGLTIEVQAPIMVFREWHRHRTQSYNEMSARYVPMPNESYLPTWERCTWVSSTNKQAQGVAPPPTKKSAEEWLGMLERLYDQAELVYQNGLNRGIPKELARLAVTVGRYSRMRASANLRNWLHFLSLRTPGNAQWEIREYAGLVEKIASQCFPRTLTLFKAGRS